VNDLGIRHDDEAVLCWPTAEELPVEKPGLEIECKILINIY